MSRWYKLKKMIENKKLREEPQTGMVAVQFEMSPAKLAEINDLATKLGCSNRDVFNTGFDLVHWAAQTIESGRLVASVNAPESTYRTFENGTLREFRYKNKVTLPPTPGPILKRVK